MRRQNKPLHAATGARGVAQTWKWSALIDGEGNYVIKWRVLIGCPVAAKRSDWLPRSCQGTDWLAS